MRSNPSARTCPYGQRTERNISCRFVLALIFALGTPIAASSLTPTWCDSNGLNVSEQMICTDGILSRLDLALNKAYRTARRAEPELGQDSWLAERDRCGASISCLETKYRSRIAELDAIADGATTTSYSRDPDPDMPSEAITVTPLSEIEKSPPRPEPDMSPSPQAMDDPRVAELEERLRRRANQDHGPPQVGTALPALGRDHLEALVVRPQLEEMTPRPWCDARRLNPTEETICADRDLSRLDALLEQVYGRTNARDNDEAQLTWLRSERDACGTNILCIAGAYANRIAALDAPLARAAEQRHDIEIPAGHYPPPGSWRIWYPDRPPGRQPPPSSCDVQVPHGAVLIEG